MKQPKLEVLDAALDALSSREDYENFPSVNSVKIEPCEAPIEMDNMPTTSSASGQLIRKSRKKPNRKQRRKERLLRELANTSYLGKIMADLIMAGSASLQNRDEGKWSNQANENSVATSSTFIKEVPLVKVEDALAPPEVVKVTPAAGAQSCSKSRQSKKQRRKARLLKEASESSLHQGTAPLMVAAPSSFGVKKSKDRPLRPGKRQRAAMKRERLANNDIDKI